MPSRCVKYVIYFYHLILCVIRNVVSSNSHFKHPSVANIMTLSIYFLFLHSLSGNGQFQTWSMPSRCEKYVIHFYHLILCVISNVVSSNSRFKHPSVANIMTLSIYSMFLGLFVRKLKMSDMKYSLQMWEICNKILPPYFMCHKQCWFIQLPL